MSSDETKPSADEKSTHNTDSIGDNHKDSSTASTAQAKRKPITAKPGDIICGRGFHIANHSGNLNLHLTMNKYRDEYLQSTRPDKTKIIKKILKEVQKTGARFIKSVTAANNVDTWEEVDYATAYSKVSHALRLRTKNETNNPKGPMAQANTLNHVVESKKGSDPLIPSRATLPVVHNATPFGLVQAPSGNGLSATVPCPPYVGGDATFNRIYRQVYLRTLYDLQQQSRGQQSTGKPPG